MAEIKHTSDATFEQDVVAAPRPVIVDILDRDGGDAA